MKQLETKKPWQQWKDETDTAYHRFTLYLKMGPERSIRQVAEKLQKSSGYEKHLRRWSSKYGWVERCKAYDDHLLNKSLKNREDLIDRAHARMLKMLDNALDQYEEILVLDNVIYVGVASTTTMNERIKVVKDILDRLGIDFSVKEGGPPKPDVTVNQYIQNIYNRMDDIENRRNGSD